MEYSLSLYFILTLKDFFSNPKFGGYLNFLLGKPLITYIYLANRIDLVIEKIKLAISVQITIVNRREIKFTS